MSHGAVVRFALYGAVVFAPLAVLAQMGPEMSFSEGATPSGMEGAANAYSPQDTLYSDGMRAINDGRWLDAETIFTKLTTQHGEHSDAALYWKAYAQNKQGQLNAALESCAQLNHEFSTSNWVHECGALEIEIQAKTGKPLEPKGLSDEDLKLLAINLLMQKDEPAALAQLQEILNSDASEELKKKATFILGQHYSDATYAQIVRISYVEGDVRIARGEQNEKPAGETWEEAVADLPLETGFSLVTGDGRAEIEFEDASTLYLGANSVLTFNDLHTTSGVPSTEVALLAGTATIAIKPSIYGETFILRTPTDYVTASYPHTAFARINSYTDAMTVTSLESKSLYFPQLGGKELGEGQTLTLHEGHLVDVTGPDSSGAFAEWDKWVVDRVAQRTAAMADVMKDAGLTSALPGLAGMKGQGTFFACAPYGTCWEPTASPTTSDDQQPADKVSKFQPGDGAGWQQPAHLMQANFLTFPRFVTAQLTPMGSPKPLGPVYPDAFSPCLPAAVRYRVEKDPITGKARVVSTGLGGNAVPWSWAVCHAGGWVHRRHHYVWCVGIKRHHIAPVRWVKSEHKVGFVPIHPFDVKGRPPINRKEEVFTINNKNGWSLERVKFGPDRKVEDLKSPPREFRNAYLRPLARAEAPHMEARAVKVALPGNKGTIAKAETIPLHFNPKSENFVVSKQVMHGGKSVTVSTPISNHAGTLQARGGSFAGGHGAIGGGSSSHGGAASGGSHGGGGGSGGGSSGGGAHGGGGGGSSGSSGGGSAGGGGGGGHR
jgi:FecR protein